MPTMAILSLGNDRLFHMPHSVSEASSPQIGPQQYLYVPLGAEPAMSISISPSGALTEPVDTEFDEIVTIADSDTWEKFLGYFDEGPVVKGNVVNLGFSTYPDPSGAPNSGDIIYQATTSTSDSSITYTITRKAKMAEDGTSPCRCVDGFQISDTTDPITFPVKLLKDGGSAHVTKLVTVTQP